MEITRHLLILVLLHLGGFCYLVNSTKKKKLLTQPHGRHVANKRGLSTLFDPHGLNGSNHSIGPGEMINMEKSPEDSKSVPFEHSGIISKAARKKKRRKKHKNSKNSRIMFIQALKLTKTCKNWSDCKEGQCCIRNMRNRGHCKKRPRKGERCKPDLLPGLESCPCDKGLTCLSYKSTRLGYKKYRCRLLNAIEDEKEQRFV